MHRGRVELVGAFACGLGRIHGNIRVAQKTVRVTGGVVAQCDTKARSRVDRSSLNRHRRNQRRDDALACTDGPSLGADVLEQDGKFVTAEASRAVGGAERFPEPPSDNDEQFVATRMTEAVVDPLEVVEVGEQHGGQPDLATAARQRLSEAIHEEGAVGETGQCIVKGEVCHRVGDARIGERDARVHRERDQHLLLCETVGAAVAVGGDGERTDHAAVLLDRRGHRRLEALAGEHWEPVLVVLIVLDDHEPAFGERPPDRALIGSDPHHERLHLRGVTAPGDPEEKSRIAGIAEAQVHGLIADELDRGRNDGVKDVLEGRPLGQRALNAGKLIEQCVAVAEHLPQPSAFLVIAFGPSPSTITHQQADARLGIDDRGRDHLCDRPVMIAERRSRGSLEAQGALPARAQTARR